MLFLASHISIWIRFFSSGMNLKKNKVNYRKKYIAISEFYSILSDFGILVDIKNDKNA